MNCQLTKEELIQEIVNFSEFYDDPEALRIRDFKSVKFIHRLTAFPKCKFISKCSLARM
jgi:hypothetical protein